MKSTIVTILCLLALTGVVYGQKDGPLKSAWTTTNPFASTYAPAATGSLQPNEVYLDKTKIDIMSSNSADKLFITIRLDNEQDHIKMLLLGSTVWVDPKGKKSTKKGIHFPLPEEQEPDGSAKGMKTPVTPPNNGNQNDNGRSERSAIIARLISHKKDMKIIGLVGASDEDEEKTGVLAYAKGDPSGIITNLEEHNNQLIYQLTIPFALLKMEPGTDQSLAIGFETGTLPRVKSTTDNSNAGGMSGMGGMYGRGMGGYGGGMYGRGMGGYGGGGSGGRQAFVQQTKFWVTVQLATQ